MSGGQAYQDGPWLFYRGPGWLAAIGYPLYGEFDKKALSTAIDRAAEKFAPEEIFAIAPAFSPESGIIEKDRYYVLSASAPIPARLRNPVRRAAESLAISEDSAFTAGHRRLWAEFLERNGSAMNGRVAQLYAATPQALAKGGGNLRLLDARDKDDNIVASLLLDYAPENFASYILGAHSRKHYAPHAVDLLFATMLANARAAGKRFIHLGLGVNDGILRFKLKWGAVPSWPFYMARLKRESREESATRVFMRALMAGPAPSARQFLQNEPAQRPFAMLWRVEKGDRVSWLAGTAHFFLHSFENSFRKLFKQVDNVIFEGPLDPAFMDQVDQAGKKLPAGQMPLLAQLEEAEISQLEKTVNGDPRSLAAALGFAKTGRRVDARWLLANASPWHAFFTLWSSYLERLGWRQSVDMEAWRIALDMKKNVIGMENLEEQLESLASLPPSRVLNFFRSCRAWKKRARHNLKAYLAGDLEMMMGSSAEFPTRTEHIVSRRDQRFRERMRPYLEEGRCAVFVGSAHLVNLRQMLVEDGFKVRQAPFGLMPKLKLAWRDLRRPDGNVKW